MADLLATLSPERLARMEAALGDLAELLEERHLTGV
jgi:hypothetical protein